LGKHRFEKAKRQVTGNKQGLFIAGSFVFVDIASRLNHKQRYRIENSCVFLSSFIQSIRLNVCKSLLRLCIAGLAFAKRLHFAKKEFFPAQSTLIEACSTVQSNQQHALTVNPDS